MQETPIYFGSCAGLINSNISKKGILFYNGFFADKDESHNLFANYIPILHKQEFSTLRFDPTGLGDSPKNLNDVTISTWIEDAFQALKLFHDSGIEQIGIVGFSLGATHAILNYSQNPKLKSAIKGFALWAPAFNPEKDMLNRYKQNGDYKKSQKRKLFKSEKRVPTKILDSLDFNVLTELEDISCPILICHSEQDPYIPIKTSRSLITKIQHLDQLFIPKNSGHSFRHLNDTDNNSPRNIVYSKTLDFFKKHLE